MIESSLPVRGQEFFRSLQEDICAALEKADGEGSFSDDMWNHEAGGGGRTRVMQNGRVFEKAGVNFSAVTTHLPESLARKLGIDPQQAFATGISLVLHPWSPMIPAVHMNLRYLELEHGDRWFGGGTDLTPAYLFTEDASHFHSTLKQVCDRFDPVYYRQFKQRCDEYFMIRHRKETRGIGGIFFDYQREAPERFFDFVRAVGEAFLPSYLPIVEKRRTELWDQAHKEWQGIRRGRYAEFNLVYDRGTLFGLETGGRIESILMSLPPEVHWTYNHTPGPGSREAALVEVLQHPREWI
jgi:coproporphyrinogen III oxidase